MILTVLVLSAGLLATPATASPDPLESLRATLGGLAGTAAVRAQVEHQFERRREDQPAAQGARASARARLSAAPDGLTISWGRDALDEVRREQDRRGADPDAPAPVTEAMANLDAATCARLLDAAGELRHDLDRAKVLEARDDTLEGAPARLLRLSLDPAVPAAQRKYVRQLDATMKLWLGADGIPLAAETHVKLSGRALLVIGFHTEQQERYRFARVGDRLVVTRREFEQRSEGGGEKGTTSSTTSLTVER